MKEVRNRYRLCFHVRFILPDFYDFSILDSIWGAIKSCQWEKVKSGLTCDKKELTKNQIINKEGQDELYDKGKRV